ncbi:unannotated protein [freshwater metagenome]|uniref:Unannotated protein n=1 Tax=freshwater metagenome TaxID=449393 RepID=A0A6J6YML0_9ZZZZ|nr:hypothetical protein [Actinomycetota bacterium]MSX45781.1 hypothetical protein [Actinomycetota bacterium]MSX73617.1 hypothetical protein [Actinomycetota bacterium]MSZ01368.1 hypothetical protein [Actinomycetota bacterium]MTB20757.1 hypothetical protein [Actinomycetota bacterium]
MRMGRVVAVLTLALLPLQFISSQASANNKCISLSAVQYLEATTKLVPLTSDFTVEFDFFLNKNEKSYAEIISQGGQPNSFYIGINPDLGIRAGDTWADTSAKMPLKSWVHIAVTHSAAGIGSIYLDGKSISSTSNYLLNQEGTNTRVGAQYGPSAGERINGCIDNLRIWKTVRTTSQVSNDAQVATSISDSAILASYEFDSVNAAGLIESSSGSNNLLKPFSDPEFVPISNPTPVAAPEFKYGGGILGSAALQDGPGFYVTADLQPPAPESFGSGFGWYSTLWALTATQVDNFQLGLSSTWIIPNNKTVSASIAQKLCATGTDAWVKNAASNPNNGSYGLYLFQTIEGSLGWWGGEKFRTTYPKYMANVTQNCYTTQLATPGWGFFSNTPTAREQTGLIQVSNQILMPPDGMVFQNDDFAPQLGVTWHSLNLPRFDHAFGSQAGDNSWTLFMNSGNFKGPLAFVAPQFWVDGSISNPLQKNMTLDMKSGSVGGLASEWNSIPYYKYVDSSGKIYTKIPDLEFPVDSNGDFSISRDFKAYSFKAISPDLKGVLSGAGNLPTTLTTQEVFAGKLVGNSPKVYQEGKTLGNLSQLLSVKVFDAGNAYGFSVPGKSGLVKLAQYFLETADAKVEVTAAQAPEPLVRASFGNPQIKSTYVYQYPSWWDASPSSSADFTNNLNDGSQVVYRWYKFVDQPALQRFELNASEKGNLQAAIEKMQKEWARSALMSEPTKGSLATFDQGMLVTPPKGLEFGYVPIAIKQYISANLASPTPAATKTASPTPIATATPTPKPSISKAAAKATRITCIKGKTIKKVTAVKPKCPAGYRKK